LAEGSPLLLAQVVLLAQADDVIQTIRVIPNLALPQPNAFTVPNHDLGAERNQRVQSDV